MPAPQRRRLALALAAAVLAVPALALVLLLNYDWNRARPWLNAKVSEALDRPFEIRGALALSWQGQGGAAQAHSWRDYLPRPSLVAHDVHLGNPVAMVQAGAPPEMASARQFAFSLNLLPLLQRQISIPELRFDTPSVLLLRTPDGKANWQFRPADKPSPWKLDLQGVVFSKGSVHYADALTQTDARAELDTVNGAPPYGVAWSLTGQWKQQAISGTGKAGAVLSLQQQNTPYPLTARLTMGATHIEVSGTLTKPTELAALDLHLKLSGNSMARLYALTGVLLPETPAFATAGHLIGTLGPAASHWRYQDFTGRVGGSDIAGTLDYQSGKPRPQLTGTVQSKLLQFSDLGPLIGADSNASKQARGVAPVQPGDKALPVEKFHTERWTALDARVGFKAQRIVRDKDLPIANVDAQLQLQDGVLSLTPLNFDIAGGAFHSTVKLDGSGKRSADAIAAELTADARHIKIKQLFPRLPAMQATVGEINADMSLSATGNSVASLLASANGELKSVLTDGSISKLLLEEMGLNIGNVVVTKLVGDHPVKLNCLVSDFRVDQGLMRTRLFVADTEDATVSVAGTVNLDNERMDLTLKPDPKGLRVITLRSPIYVRGTFKQPEVSIDKGVMALRAGGALALAAVAPVAAILPLIHAGPGETPACGALLSQVKGKAVGPPPGHSRARVR